VKGLLQASVLCSAAGVKRGELTYAISLDEDEITLLIQLLNERVVELEREHPSSPDTPVRPPAALLQKLLSLRRNVLVAARAAGKLQ
jgi:hypothetical protein